MDSFTSAEIVGMFTNGSWIETLLNLGVFIAGLITHVYKKMKNEDITFKQYWKNNGYRSAASIGTLVTTFLGMAVMGDVSLFNYFSVAYMSDSLVNKAPKKTEIKPELR